MPGVSSSSTLLLSLIHCFPFVTPGLFPVLAQAFPAYELINVDFPTFGMPTTIALTGLFLIPRFRSLSIFSLQASITISVMLFMPDLLLASRLTTKKPFSLKNALHSLVRSLSARSALFIRMSLYLFFPSSSMSGLRLDSGILASTSSITRSINLISSCI